MWKEWDSRERSGTSGPVFEGGLTKVTKRIYRTKVDGARGRDRPKKKSTEGAKGVLEQRVFSFQESERRATVCGIFGI